MEEKKEKKVDTEELKTEATNTVNQVKNTIKKVDIKKDSLETKGFIIDMFRDPLGKIKQIVTKDNGKFLTYTIIILVIWTAAKLLHTCFSLSKLWGYSHMGASLLGIVTATITPILMVLVMSFILFFMNTKNKKSLTTIITVVTTANLPIVIGSVISLLNLFGTQASILTIPIANLCSVISVILMYFATKAILGIEKNSDFIKKFVIIEGIYYITYFVLSFLGIYL